MYECMYICMYMLYCCDNSRILSMYYVYICIIYVFVQIRALAQEE